MENNEVINSVKTEVINHLESNFSLLLEEESKMNIGHKAQDVRGMYYYFKVYTDAGWKTITYDFTISVEDGR